MTDKKDSEHLIHDRQTDGLPKFSYAKVQATVWIKTRKHPVSCRQSDIRRWITGSISNDSHPVRGTSSESYALHIEQLSSTENLTGAQKQQLGHLMLETSLGDNQEDATSHDVIIDSNNDDLQQGRHPQLAANDQHKLPSDACRSPLIRHGNMHDYDRAALPPARLEIDRKERRYSISRHDDQSCVIVQSTRLPMFQSDAYEKRYASRQESCQAEYNLADNQQEEVSFKIPETLVCLYASSDSSREHTIFLVYNLSRPRGLTGRRRG